MTTLKEDMPVTSIIQNTAYVLTLSHTEILLPQVMHNPLNLLQHIFIQTYFFLRSCNPLNFLQHIFIQTYSSCRSCNPLNLLQHIFIDILLPQVMQSSTFVTKYIYTDILLPVGHAIL